MYDTDNTGDSEEMDFGHVEKCTTAELLKEIKNLYSKCYLDYEGMFYFVIEEPSSHVPSFVNVYLKFFDRDRQKLHTSHVPVFVCPKETTKPSFAIDKNTFILEDSDTWTILSLNKDWSARKSKYWRTRKSDLVNYFSIHLRGTGSALGKIRNGTPGDFHLKSSQGDLIEVHTTVLVPLWPFFAAAINSEMKEAAERVLQIQCPTSTLEVIVRHVYDQELDLQFDDALNLVETAQMYELPELLRIAIQSIKSRENTVEDLMTIWERSRTAENENLKRYCAQLMVLKPDELEDKVAKLKNEDLFALFMDVARLGKRGYAQVDQ